MKRSHRDPYTVRGVTLVELLVVITILMMLAAFAIPTMRPLTEGRRIREAARAIDVFLTQTKTRAVEIQRPVGVLLERMTQIDRGADPDDPADDTLFYQSDACNVLRAVEIPPPYAGDFADSRVRVQNWTTVRDTSVTPERRVSYMPGLVVLKLVIQDGAFSNRLLKWGDSVQLNYQGPVFKVFDDQTDNSAGSTGKDFKVDADGYILFSDTPNGYPTVNLQTGWVTSHVLTVATSAAELGGVSWPLTNKTTTDNIVDPATLMNGGEPLWSADTTFQFFRQPQPSPVPPLRLPRNTVIDLADSGYYIGLPDQIPSTAAVLEGSDVYPTAPLVRYAFETYEQDAGVFMQFPDAFGRIGNSGTDDDYRGPMILFAPNGAIQSVYHWQAQNPADPPSYGPTLVTRPVFLMVGKWERTGTEPITSGSPVRSLAEDQLHNWQDASNIWIAIGPQNGFVTAADVTAPFATPAGDSVPGNPAELDPGLLGEQMQTSRQYAREAQISKGALEE